MIWLERRKNKDKRSKKKKKEQETWCGDTNEFIISGLHIIYWVVMGAVGKIGDQVMKSFDRYIRC